MSHNSAEQTETWFLTQLLSLFAGACVHRKMMEVCGEAENRLASELMQHELQIEKDVLDPLSQLAEVWKLLTVWMGLNSSLELWIFFYIEQFPLERLRNVSVENNDPVLHNEQVLILVWYTVPLRHRNLWLTKIPTIN